jgi:hypothetical protein
VEEPAAGLARYWVPPSMSSAISDSATAMAKPKARMMFPLAAITRGAPTTGAPVRAETEGAASHAVAVRVSGRYWRTAESAGFAIG